MRIARWLGAGFEEIGRDLDVVWLEGPRGESRRGHIREVRLDAGRASRSVGALRGYFEAVAPPLALVTPGYLAPFAIAAGRRTATSVVPWEAGFAAREVRELSARMRLVPLLQKLTYRRAGHIAAVSSSVAASIGRDVVVIPNPVDAREIRTLSNEYEVPLAGGFDICAIGKLTPYKGYDVLLEAVGRAGPRLGKWSLRIVGDGPQRPALERAARRLGIDEQISFLGFVENPYPELRASSLFVQPSRFEGFGVTIVEALALRVPVVATASGGPEDVLDGGRYGLLVPPGDADALAAAILRVAVDEELRNRLSDAADGAAERYAPATAASAVMRLVDTVRR